MTDTSLTGGDAASDGREVPSGGATAGTDGEADGTDDSDERYVHRPGDASAHDGASSGRGPVPGRALSRRAGWGVVALLVVCLVGFPVVMLVWPPTFVPYRDAYLGLAFVPGALLGAAAVWLFLRTGR